MPNSTINPNRKWICKNEFNKWPTGSINDITVKGSRKRSLPCTLFFVYFDGSRSTLYSLYCEIEVGF
ncbi:hypothetical protein V1478_002061 [Vespula squamosa]|uniref:Uncharacterized protein n=1 Tax=Vespula squamosa TaxID=30214 RepID=A0ABD2BYW8_VESSQ